MMALPNSRIRGSVHVIAWGGTKGERNFEAPKFRSRLCVPHGDTPAPHSSQWHFKVVWVTFGLFLGDDLRLFGFYFSSSTQLVKRTRHMFSGWAEIDRALSGFLSGSLFFKPTRTSIFSPSLHFPPVYNVRYCDREREPCRCGGSSVSSVFGDLERSVPLLLPSLAPSLPSPLPKAHTLPTIWMVLSVCYALIIALKALIQSLNSRFWWFGNELRFVSPFTPS